MRHHAQTCTCLQSPLCTTEHWSISNAAPLFPNMLYSLGANERIARSMSSAHPFYYPLVAQRDGTSFDSTDTAVDEWQSLWLSSSAFALLSKTRLMKSWNGGWDWWPPVAETCCETAQRGPTFTTSTASNTIVPLWRQFKRMRMLIVSRQQSHRPHYAQDVRVAWVLCTALCNVKCEWNAEQTAFYN